MMIDDKSNLPLAFYLIYNRNVICFVNKLMTAIDY